MKYQAALFDLDGVLVDTARYHYRAWKELAASLGFEFSVHDNERLKGVSRAASLEILLEVGGLATRFSAQEKQILAARKNARYVEFLATMEPSEILPGVLALLGELRSRGVKTALGSASKNAPFILERLALAPWFDVLIDGNAVSKAKPDPEVFLLGARRLGIRPSDCVVFEDAEAGLQAAKAGGMFALGLGQPQDLPSADVVYPHLVGFDPQRYFTP